MDTRDLTSERSTRHQTIALALGGGGGKGFAHVGVLAELAEQGREIAGITGTSIGSAIGALFAIECHRRRSLSIIERQRHAAKSVETVFIGTSFRSLVVPNCRSMMTKGLLKSHRLDNWLRRRLMADSGTTGIRFGDLDFDLSITVTDAHTGQSHELNSQSAPGLEVYRAVRASCSIPLVFGEVSVDVDGKRIVCWDGGVTGNCRFDLSLRRFPTVPTVAVSLTYRGGVVETRASSLTAITHPFRLANQASNIMLRQFEDAVFKALSPVEQQRVIILRPDLGNASTFGFWLDRRRREQLIDSGRIATKVGFA